jgi:S1-C subfamily serine protease
MEVGPVIALQRPGQLRNLAQLMLMFALAVLKATVAHAAASDLSDTLERVNPTAVEIRSVSSSSFQQRDGTTATSELSLGSGVLIASDQVLTASHLVETADRIQIRLLDGTTRQARVSSSEQFADVSLLTLDAPVSGIEPIKLGDSDRTRIGERVFAVGAP